MNKLAYMLLFLLGMLGAKAQEAAGAVTATTEKEPEMADLFRSEGKIYVVIAVMAITFLCLIGYLIYIDLRLRKLEQSSKS